MYQNKLQISEIPFLAICQVLFLSPPLPDLVSLPDRTDGIEGGRSGG